MSISQTVTPVPTPVPNRSEQTQSEFDVASDNLFSWLEDLPTELNAWAAQVNALGIDASTAQVALAAANFRGWWSGKSGTAAPPYAVAHDGYVWMLLTNLANIAASEPSGANDDWLKIGPPLVASDIGATVCAQHDARLTDARVPVAHASDSGTYGYGTVEQAGHLRVGAGLTATNGTVALNLAAVNAWTGHQTFMEVSETVHALSGTTPALDPGNGTIQTWTLTGNSTPTDSLTSGQSLLLMIDDGSARSITWPNVTWKTNGGAAPPLNETGLTAIALWKVGTTLYGARVGDA